ncbi:hypothetical protein ACFV1F_23565 [Streptomyces sp. NPDC059590]|uniref:hypothetical protein n=1 Tax=Streptomyces sp. NPDC059590 TaxID=3346877 RepID=UPI0036991735
MNHPNARTHSTPGPGQQAYDPISDRTGVVQAIHATTELLFDHRMTGSRVAFLRPARGGVEWTADAATLRFSPEAKPRP